MMFAIEEYSKSSPTPKNVFLLDKSEILIGRNQSANIPVLDKGVSRRHAVLKLINDKWTIIDCGSANGVYVGNEKIKAETPHGLKEGERFYLSEPTLTGRSFLFQKVLTVNDANQNEALQGVLPQVETSPLPNSDNITISPVTTMPVKRHISHIRKSAIKRKESASNSSYCEYNNECTSSTKENKPVSSTKKSTSRRNSIRINNVKRRLQNSLVLEDNVESPRKKKLSEKEYLKLQLELEERNKEVELKKQELAKLQEQLEQLLKTKQNEKEALQEVGIQADRADSQKTISPKASQKSTEVNSQIIAELEAAKKELNELRQKPPGGITVDDLSCSICFNPMINATLLDCGHSFCELCIKIWRNQSQSNSCPYCRKEFAHVRPLHLINNLVQKFFDSMSPEKRKEWERVVHEHEVQISVLKVTDFAQPSTLSSTVEELSYSQRTQLRRNFASSVIDMIRNPDEDVSPDRFFAFPLNVRLQVLQHLSTFRECLNHPNPSPEELERFGASIMTP